MSSQSETPADTSIDELIGREDSAQRVARLTTLLQDLQAHTDALFELAKEATLRARKAVNESDVTMRRTPGGRARRR